MSIELKRVVMIKAIVTEAFKENLVKELQRAKGNLEREFEQVGMRFQHMIEAHRARSPEPQAIEGLRTKMDEEMSSRHAAIADLEKKMAEARSLHLGSEFVQGPLEGPVTVGVGDNLYKKVGGAEIILQDGIIVEIRGVE